MKEPVLVALVGLFVVLLLVRLVRGFLVGRRLGAEAGIFSSPEDPELTSLVKKAQENEKVHDALREIERRASGVGSASLRAAYHCAAGHVSMTQLKRPKLAAGYYIRALREDPSYIDAIDKLRDILAAQKRYRRLEWIYWDVLGRLGASEVGSEMWIKCWSGLASVYSASQRTVRRADAIRKALLAVTPDEDDDDDDDAETASQLPRVVS